MEILKTIDLEKCYFNNKISVKAVDKVNITVDRGEYVAIIGQSGSGKSTLLNLLGGLDKPDSGNVIVNGKSIYEENDNLTVFRRKNIGFIFQAYNLVPFLNVWENIILPLGLDGREMDKTFVDDLIKSLELEEKKTSYPEELSGGQQQRVAIARALVMKPAIILADEPTGNLDSKTSDKVISLLLDICKKYNQTLIIVTHNELIADKADKIIQITDGKAVYL